MSESVGNKEVTNHIKTFDFTLYSLKIDPGKTILEQCHNLSYDLKFEFPRKKLHLVRTVGEGAFGQVWMATAEGMNVFKPRETRKSRNILRHFKRSGLKKSVVAIKCLKG